MRIEADVIRHSTWRQLLKPKRSPQPIPASTEASFSKLKQSLPASASQRPHPSHKTPHLASTQPPPNSTASHPFTNSNPSNNSRKGTHTSHTALSTRRTQFDILVKFQRLPHLGLSERKSLMNAGYFCNLNLKIDPIHHRSTFNFETPLT